MSKLIDRLWRTETWFAAAGAVGVSLYVAKAAASGLGYCSATNRVHTEQEVREAVARYFIEKPHMSDRLLRRGMETADPAAMHDAIDVERGGWWWFLEGTWRTEVSMTRALFENIPASQKPYLERWRPGGGDYYKISLDNCLNAWQDHGPAPGGKWDWMGVPYLDMPYDPDEEWERIPRREEDRLEEGEAP